MTLRISLTVALMLLSASAAAAQPAIETACVPVEVSQLQQVRQICASVGAAPTVEIAAGEKDVWTSAAKHGVTMNHVTGRYSRFNDAGVVRSMLADLGVEAVIFVEVRSGSEAGLISFGFDGSRTVVPVKLVDGKLSKAEGRKMGGFTVRNLRNLVDEFRARGGWAGTVTASELAGLDPAEQMTLKLKKTARCFRYEKKWLFCQAERIGTSGFIFGQKGKPFTFVKAGGSFVGGVHLGTFEEPGFERARDRRVTSKDFDPFVGAGAPALLIKPSESRAALSCGQKTEFLDALSYAESRKLLADVTIRFAPPERLVGLKKTKDGTYVWTETIRYASGEPEFRVFVGKPPKLTELTIKDRAMLMDGGTTIYEFASGGGLFLPANMWIMKPSDKDPGEKTMPDGSKVPATAEFAGQGFKWAQYRASAKAKPQNLYVVDDAEMKKVLKSVKTPLPVDNQKHEIAVCSVVMPGARNK